MTMHGPRTTSPGPDSMLWALGILIASVAGGLAAAALVTLSSKWIALAVPAIIGPTIAQAVLNWRSRQTHEGETGLGSANGSVSSSGLPSDRHDGRYGKHAHQTGPAAADSPAMVQALPVPEASVAGTPWWEKSPTTPRPGRSSTELVDSPDLRTFLASALIAQCPNCGAFKLDIRRGPRMWAFRCEECEHTWTWQSGTPWPAVRVAPRRRTRSPTLEAAWQDSTDQERG